MLVFRFDYLKESIGKLFQEDGQTMFKHNLLPLFENYGSFKVYS